MSPLKHVKPPRFILFLLLIIGILSSFICFLSFLILHHSKKEEHQTVQHYYIIAGCLAFMPPIIMCVTLIFIIGSDRSSVDSVGSTHVVQFLDPPLIKGMTTTQDGCGKIDLHQYLKQSFFLLGDLINVNYLLALGRIVVTLMACFQLSQISDQSSPYGFYAVMCSLIGSFCLAEYMSLMEEHNVISVCVEKDLGFFSYVIASALCAIQHVYGVGKYMVIVFFTCMFLDQVHGFILSSTPIIFYQDHTSQDAKHHANGINNYVK